MKIAEEDIEKTRFNKKPCHFEFTDVPFGLNTAPAAFMSMIDNVVKSYPGEFVMAYLDDILVYRKTWDEHFQHVRKIL